MPHELYIDLSNFGEQLLLHDASETPDILGIPAALPTTPTLSTVTNTNTIDGLVTTHGHSNEVTATSRSICYLPTGLTEETAEGEQRETTDSGDSVLLSTISAPRYNQHINPGTYLNSKHGKTENHFCTYRDCHRSRPGSGFCRKDHLDQHLRGVHKQKSVSRLRARSTTAPNSLNATPSNTTIAQLLQRKKSRGGDREGSVSLQNRVEVAEELLAERRLRVLAEEENLQLRQKLENYEIRMQKYEERLDKMMSLVEQHSRK